MKVTFEIRVEATYYTIDGAVITTDQENWHAIGQTDAVVVSNEVVLASKKIEGQGVWATYDQAKTILEGGELKPQAQARATELGLGDIFPRCERAFLSGGIHRIK